MIWGTSYRIRLESVNNLRIFRMPLDETLETFSYFISEADKLGIAYVTLLRYVETSDPVIDGKQSASLVHNCISY